ncbi:MAG: hypothetical protein A2020_07130 [Lentisphaerae bacterium GWF2_45_14]|nr:MAG: hypothetical protein A2020_07130 [Lentisphaerae bacterium GWF2_45_14]
MKLIFITDHMKFSGGRRLMFDYALYLMKKGHEVSVLVEKKEGGLSDYIPAKVVPALSAEHIPEADLIIATSPKEVRQAWEAHRGKVVHFCQGLELVDLEQRISGAVTPIRYQGNGILKKLKIFKKKFEWRRKHRIFDDAYKLPTHLIAITDPMCKYLEDRYQRPAYLCRNGVDLENLNPRADWKPEHFTETRPMRIVNVGPIEVTYKGIPVTVKAVEMARARDIPLDFMRLASIAGKNEMGGGLTYNLLLNSPRREFCEALSSCDVYISNSTEREGFGLPAVEAMASGLLCILSDITAYRSFSSETGHCIFVPGDDAGATADAIEKIYKMPLSEMSQMRAKAITLASQFSHQKACAEFEQILEKINAL